MNKGKKKRVLVIGDPEMTACLLHDSRAEHHSFTYCAGDNCANISTGQDGQHYEWIIINGEVLGRDETDLIQSLRAMGLLNAERPAGTDTRCGVEWLRDGSLQLRCCMKARRQVPEVSAQSPVEQQEPGFVFEYHAPVKRTG